MTDLSHWDFEEIFTAKEIAALIRGIDPASNDAPSIQDNDPVLSQVTKAYEAAYFEVILQWNSQLEFDLEECRNEMDHACLRCKGMFLDLDELIQVCIESGAWERAEMQEFHRSEIARWLKHMKFKSAYTFESPSDDEEGVKHDPSNSVPTPREEKGTPKEKRAKQLIEITARLQCCTPYELKVPKGNVPGPRSEIFDAFRKQNPGVGDSSIESAWTRARLLTDPNKQHLHTTARN